VPLRPLRFSGAVSVVGIIGLLPSARREYPFAFRLHSIFRRHEENLVDSSVLDAPESVTLAL
jgi:hypothetical protein